MYEQKKGIFAMLSLNTARKPRQLVLVSQILVAAIIAVILAAGNYQTSQAASLTPHIDTTTCADPGALVDVYPINANGTKIGEIDLFYNRKSGTTTSGATYSGFNCAWTWTAGPAYGKAQHITVSMVGCDSNEGETCHPDGQDDDTGDYHSYAGPAASTGSSGLCISVQGSITWKGTTYEGGTNNKAVHCGK